MSAPQMSESKNYRTLVLWLLTLVYVMNFIDRQIIGILSPSIKAELGFSDGQLGLLKGFGFALLYTTVGIPIAWLADRYSRVKIVTVSLTLWSGFTALTGMAGNFLMMLAARTGVGIGEAGGSPPSHSIISDLYPKEQRASALGVYSLGIPVGIAFSYILAGMLVESLGWRGTLICLGVAGIVLAFVLVLVVKEPKRGQLEGKNIQLKPVGIGESIATLTKIPSWWAMCMGIAWVSFGGYAVANWGIDYIVRYMPEYMPGAEEGKFGWLMLMYGLIHLIGYGAGTYYGALITEKLAHKNISAYGWMPGAVLFIGVPALIAAFWVESINLHLLFITIYLIAAGFYLGPSFAAAQTLAPINMRAMSTALFFLILNLIALGGGPTYVGYASEMLTAQHGEVHALRLAITTLVVPYIISIIAFFWAAKTLPKDWKEAEARNKQMAMDSS
ncbi:MAG: MFS transporter [Gammaproteobacteria bacterium]|nr:MFS transporter [Gammaproteobacteria bacterium]NNC96497.1 MFS transporter [Gammaproteobacteria bacterium]NNM14719.1 MFS transporter [Gammaproteobacteria bacterium]